ncbi:pali-domain-containing protein [Amylostereum chailletii]|nr:pali-domain-containing protein [Amylostereum chailletii]
MSRTFCIPGIFFLFAALVLNILVSVSLPALPALDIARTKYAAGSVSATGVQGDISEIRFGIWAYCVYENGDRTCVNPGHGYAVEVSSGTNSDEQIGTAWTRGLAVHPVAAAVTLIAFACAFSTHITLMLLASILSFLAALLTLIAFAIDIALFVFVHNKMNNLDNVRVKTDTGAGFWMTLAAFILLLLAGCTVCFGRRRERMASATTAYPEKPGVFGRVFRRKQATV